MGLLTRIFGQASVSATDAVTEGLLARARGRDPSPEDVAAVVACRGVWSRCGHSMAVEGSLSGQLQPLLPWIMSALAAHGNCYLRTLTSGRLMPCGLASIQGGAMPSSWEYHLTELAPTKARTVVVPGRSVIHLKINVDAMAPWRGRPPLLAGAARAPVEVERALVRLARQARTHLTFDDKISPDQRRGIQTVLRESLEDDLTPMLAGRGGKFTQPTEIGAGIAATRGQLAAHIAVAYGLGAEWFAAEAGGTASRENWRQYLNHTLQPIASMIEREVGSKTGAETRISIERLRLVDLVSAAKAFAVFREDMDEQEALERAGLG